MSSVQQTVSLLTHPSITIIIFMGCRRSDPGIWRYLLLFGDACPAGCQSRCRRLFWLGDSGDESITHEFISLEIGNFLSGSGSCAKFEPFVRSLRADRFTTILTASSDLLNRGVALYHDRLDKTWSLTDCISFEIMRERGITDALTADRHLEQAGFNILLKSPQ